MSSYLARDLSPAGAPQFSVGWTEERVETLKKLWTDGLSCSQIAKQLGGGATRNSVIGKVSRLGLQKRITPSTPRRATSRKIVATMLTRHHVHGAVAGKRAAATYQAKQTIAPSYIPLPEPLTSTVSDVLELQPHQCKWPMTRADGGEGFSFCGREAEGVYCEAHAQRASGVAPKKRSIKPDRVRTFDGFEMKVG